MQTFDVVNIIKDVPINRTLKKICIIFSNVVLFITFQTWANIFFLPNIVYFIFIAVNIFFIINFSFTQTYNVR